MSAAAVRWSCFFCTEERRAHSPSCPLRGPAWRLPPRFSPPAVLADHSRRQVRNVARSPALWLDDDDDLPRQRRYAEAAQLRQAGLSWGKIGEVLGISGQLARLWALRATD